MQLHSITSHLPTDLQRAGFTADYISGAQRHTGRVEIVSPCGHVVFENWLVDHSGARYIARRMTRSTISPWARKLVSK